MSQNVRTTNGAKTCLNCSLAKWNRTEAGRLHPSGEGRCQWKMPEITLPSPFYFIYSRRIIPQPYGGNIQRKTPEMNCPTWARIINTETQA